MSNDKITPELWGGIVRMYLRGYTDSEIANRFELDRHEVAQVISSHNGIKKAHKNIFYRKDSKAA